MAAQCVGLFMFLWIIGSVNAGETVKAKPGQNVTLQCNNSTYAAITLLEWKKLELKQYVFYFRDNESMESFQIPRYRGRVELKDPGMKNGDASVLLKNVSTDDTGTYECWVITHSNNRRKRDLGELVGSVHLIVSGCAPLPRRRMTGPGWKAACLQCRDCTRQWLELDNGTTGRRPSDVHEPVMETKGH